MKEYIDALIHNGYFPKSSKDCTDELVTIVVKTLLDRNLKITTAESCTGGLLSLLITSVPNASRVFELGLCTYSEQSKSTILGVPADIIESHGVFSARCACEMASAAAKLSNADIAVSVTGIAGPSGGTPELPVGTVFLGFSIKNNCFACKLPLYRLEVPTRKDIRDYAALAAFEILYELLMRDTNSPD